MILPQAWHSEMVFLRNEVSFTCECFNINMQWSQVTRKECSEVGKQRLRGRGTLGDLTCWMRTSFSSFITLVKSSIWFDSCFVLIPKRNEKRCIFADGLKKKILLSSLYDIAFLQVMNQCQSVCQTSGPSQVFVFATQARLEC